MRFKVDLDLGASATRGAPTNNSIIMRRKQQPSPRVTSFVTSTITTTTTAISRTTIKQIDHLTKTRTTTTTASGSPWESGMDLYTYNVVPNTLKAIVPLPSVDISTTSITSATPTISPQETFTSVIGVKPQGSSAPEDTTGSEYDPRAVVIVAATVGLVIVGLVALTIFLIRRRRRRRMATGTSSTTCPAPSTDAIAEASDNDLESRGGQQQCRPELRVITYIDEKTGLHDARQADTAASSFGREESTVNSDWYPPGTQDHGEPDVLFESPSNMYFPDSIADGRPRELRNTSDDGPQEPPIARLYHPESMRRLPRGRLPPEVLRGWSTESSSSEGYSTRTNSLEPFLPSYSLISHGTLPDYDSLSRTQSQRSHGRVNDI